MNVFIIWGEIFHETKAKSRPEFLSQEEGRFPSLKSFSEEPKHWFMKRAFTAVIEQDEGWWIGWVEEIPGVNSQGKTRRELMKHLRSALKEALEFNRSDALS